MSRQPLALANWKMAMTVAEGLAFVRELQDLIGDLRNQIDVIICPPFTSLSPIAQALKDSPFQLGGQNIAPLADPAHTGEVSAALIADVGCQWVMLGHWEVRRHLGDDDISVNRKLHLALQAGLNPIVFIGESQDNESPLEAALAQQLTAVLTGCQATQVAKMAFVYEPEWAIGMSTPASSEHVDAGCGLIRGCLRKHWGNSVANGARIIYGGSVTPERALNLLASPDVDGLGATRRGRAPSQFAEIVQQILQVRTDA